MDSTGVVTEASVTRGAALEKLAGEQWRSRAVLARAVGVAWYAVHFGVAFVVTSLVVRWLGPSDGWLTSIGRFAGLCVVASASLEITQRLGRRLIPLRALLRLSLAFPGVAPSRYAIALRSGNPRFLARRLQDANENGISAEPDDAAVALLELVAALSRHDRALRGHSERVRAYSELVAEEFGLDAGARDGIRWAGLMHDVGKLEIPASVLNKAGPLSSDEWELIRSHPTIGAELCAPLEPWLGEWSAAVIDHHERWDGGGYPRGLEGTEISLAGRVVAVADAFDVMTSARSYKRPRPVDQALEELVRCSGTQFDPMVVRAFLGIPVPKLRRVMGPVIVWAQRPFGGWSWGKIADRLGGSLVAVCVAAIVGLLAPVLDVGTDAPSPRTPGPSTPASGAALDRADATLDDGAVDERMAADAGEEPSVGHAAEKAADPSTPPRLLPPAPLPPPPPPSSAPPPAPPGGGGDGDPPGPTSPPSELGITIDPSDGSVSVDGLGPPEAPSVPIVQQPSAGDALCGGAGVCQPVTVTVPLP